MSSEPPTLPCPFCGKLNWGIGEFKATGAYFVECGSCYAKGPHCLPTRVHAINGWNTRLHDNPHTEQK